jgi:hypothetical protein
MPARSARRNRCSVAGYVCIPTMTTSSTARNDADGNTEALARLDPVVLGTTEDLAYQRK